MVQKHEQKLDDPLTNVHGKTVSVSERSMLIEAVLSGARDVKIEKQGWENRGRRIFHIWVSQSSVNPMHWVKHPKADSNALSASLVVKITVEAFSGPMTVTIGDRAPAKPPSPQPQVPPAEPTEQPPAVQEQTETKPHSGDRVSKVEQQSKNDPKGALKEAGELSKPELNSLGSEPRKSLLHAAADASSGSAALQIAHDLITTTPDRDAGPLADALQADGGKLLDDLKRKEKDPAGASALDQASRDLEARRLDAPAPMGERDYVKWTPELQKKADEVREALKNFGSRKPDLNENMVSRPEWNTFKDKQKADLQRELRNLEREVKSWDSQLGPSGLLGGDAAAGIGAKAHEDVDKALQRVQAATTIAELMESRKLAKTALWRASQMMDAKKRLQGFELGVQAWNKTQSGWASLASVPSHALAGVSSDRPDQIAANARAEVNRGLDLLRDAKTPEDMSRAATQLKQAMANADHALSAHQDEVYEGGDRTITAIKVGAVATTAVVSAPVIFSAVGGAGVLTLGGKVVVLGATGIGTGLLTGTVGGSLESAHHGLSWENYGKGFADYAPVGFSYGTGYGLGQFLGPSTSLLRGAAIDASVSGATGTVDRALHGGSLGESLQAGGEGFLIGGVMGGFGRGVGFKSLPLRLGLDVGSSAGLAYLGGADSDEIFRQALLSGSLGLGGGLGEKAFGSRRTGGPNPAWEQWLQSQYAGLGQSASRIRIVPMLTVGGGLPLPWIEIISNKPLASSAFEPGKAPRKPKDVSGTLRLFGLTEGEILGFRGEDASRLGPRSANRVVRLGEHFTPEDLKALGKHLEGSGRVLDDAMVEALIDQVPPGKMEQALQSLEVYEVWSAQSGQVSDSDLTVNTRGVRLPPRVKAPKSPIDVPVHELAEHQLLPVLKRDVGAGGGEWIYHERVQAPGAEFGETLGSTIPEYYNAKQGKAFEVKRLNLAELGISPTGKTVDVPSSRSFKALIRARLQLGGRRWDLPEGTEQNIVFNITGQAKDPVAVGKQLKNLLEKRRIKYDRFWVQDGAALTEIK
jgi:hypothetical protein